MKKLLIIPAVLAITSLSGAAFADSRHVSAPTWTNSFNTTNTSTINQGISKVSGYHSTAYNTADVQQFGASCRGRQELPVQEQPQRQLQHDQHLHDWSEYRHGQMGRNRRQYGDRLPGWGVLRTRVSLI